MTTDDTYNEHKTLIEAFMALQADLDEVTLTKNKPVSAGARSYNYMTLDSMMDAVRPLLVKHGLAWTTQPSGTLAEPTLKYRLAWNGNSVINGEMGISGEMPLYLGGQPTAQAYGSALTYARRYSLMAVLGLAAEDDDGKAASQPRTREADKVIGLPESARYLTGAERVKVIHAIETAGQAKDLVFASVGVSRAGDLTVEHAKQIRTLLDKAAAEDFGPSPGGEIGEEEIARLAAEAFNGTVETS